MEKVEMHVPNKAYDGYYGGVKFTKGVGIFTDVTKAKELAERYDYKIVEEKKEVAVKPTPKKRVSKAKVTPKVGE